MADKSGLSYIPGTEAAQEYEEAMRMLRESLSARQKPLFDPTFLAIAQGAGKAAPGGVGQLAANISESLMTEQERARKQQEQDIASRMELAKFGMGIEQQKQRGKAFEFLIGGNTPTARVTTGGGGLPAPSAVSSQPPTAEIAPKAPPGFEGIEGVQIQPPNRAFVDRNTYLRLAQADQSVSPTKAIETAQELEKKRYETKEGGVLDLATGMFYAFPKSEQVERQLFGEGGGKTYKVDHRTATLLDKYASTDDPRYFDLVNKITRGPKAKAEEGKEGKEVRVPSLEERALTEAEAKTRAEETGRAAAKGEEALKQKDTAARLLYFNTQDVKNRIAQSPTYFGIFTRPGLMSSIGRLVNEGFRAGQTSISLGGFEDAIRQAMPGVKQRDLDNVATAAGSLAEIELGFTRLYLSGQGQVTEGERAVVRKIPGTISSSPTMLKEKMDLLEMRAQFDMDIANKYRDWKKQNPGKGYNAFEESDAYADTMNKFQTDLAERFKTTPAVPSGQRAPAIRPGGWADRLNPQRPQ